MQRAIQATLRLSKPLWLQTSTAVRHSSSTGRRTVFGVVDFYKDDPQVFNQRIIDYFNRPDIDGWMIRQAMQEMNYVDMFPEPALCVAALRACRKVNDHALAVRFLEQVRAKCGNRVEDVYFWIIQEVRPVLTELGISTPEELGYDKPELYMPLDDFYDWEYYGHDKPWGPKRYDDPKVHY